MDLLIREEFVKKAAALHHGYPVADAHLDLAGEILLRYQAGEREVIRQHYLKGWQSAGLNLVVSSVYVPTALLKQDGEEAAWENALAQIDALKKEAEETESVLFVRNQEELNRAAETGQTGILLYMEGLDVIGSDIGRLETLYNKGVRGASLTWSRENALATGCCTAGKRMQMPGRLKPAGREAVKELERLSMFLDISHLNDDGFKEVCEIAKRPFLATHSNAWSVYENYRNLRDSQMDALAQRGGVMGLNGCKYITGSLSGNHLEMLCKHAEYEVKHLGASHVGFGFDLCDSYDRAAYALRRKIRKRVEQEPEKADCLTGQEQIPLVTAALLQRGMCEEDAVQVIGGSFFSYFRKYLPKAAT